MLQGWAGIFLRRACTGSGPKKGVLQVVLQMDPQIYGRPHAQMELQHSPRSRVYELYLASLEAS